MTDDSFGAAKARLWDDAMRTFDELPGPVGWWLRRRFVRKFNRMEAKQRRYTTASLVRYFKS